MGVGYARYTELGIAEIGNIKPTHIKRFYALLKEKDFLIVPLNCFIVCYYLVLNWL